jgi:hypothetical protein
MGNLYNNNCRAVDDPEGGGRIQDVVSLVSSAQRVWCDTVCSNKENLLSAFFKCGE